MNTDWNCHQCATRNIGGVRYCELCGLEHQNPSPPPAIATVPSAYREAQPRERPACSPDDRCQEPGCGKTVRDHIDEAKGIGASSAWEMRFGSRRG
jgi:hypothetical protein